jgi:ubiquitin carboxyl-terminal hydrolase 8
MNSIIQCINNTTPLMRYFCLGEYHEDVNHHNNCTRGEVAEEVAAVVRALWSGEFRSIACRDLKRVVGQHRKQFRGYEQQDSHEFLTILMDWLHEDLNKVQIEIKHEFKIIYKLSEKGHIDMRTSLLQLHRIFKSLF